MSSSLSLPSGIKKAGYHADMAIKAYAADPWSLEPSLSKGTVHDLVYRTPARAFAFHPRLGKLKREASGRSNFGTAVHSDILGGHRTVYAPAEFKDWRKDAAKAFAAEAEERGEIPLLEKERQIVVDCAGLGRQMLLAECGTAWQKQTEMTVIAVLEIGGVKIAVRGRADALDDDQDIDLKTATNCDPQEWVRFAAIKGGYDIQAALRYEAHLAITGKPKRMVWAIIEDEPPYDRVVLDISESLLALGRRKLDIAAPRWRQCLDSGHWPSYTRTTARAPQRAEFDLAERV
jgi:hypothetical protein